MRDLTQLVDDLLLPTTNSVTILLRWAVPLLANDTGVQKRLQSELDAAVGPPAQLAKAAGAIDLKSFSEKREQLAFSKAVFYEVLISFADLS